MVRGRASRSTLLIFFLLGLALAFSLWMTGPPGPDEDWSLRFLCGYIAAWFCYLAVAVVVSKRRCPAPRWFLFWIVIAAIGFRLLALERTPTLSTDMCRYLWDGRVANAGINPYLYPPNALEVRHLRDSNWQNINFKHISTIYPPTAQMLFAGLARLQTSESKGFRWAFTILDVGSILALIVLLRRTGRPPERVIWYAWCPLAITEVTAGAHVDAFALFLFLLSLLAVGRREGRPGLISAILLVASVMAKGYSLLALPFFLRQGGQRFALTFSAACAAFLLPYLGAGLQLFSGFRAYLGSWDTNASFFLVLNSLLARFTQYHFGLSRGLTIGIVLLFIGVLAWRLRPGLEWLLGASFAAFGAQLLLGAPTLPWYALWLVPVLCWWTVPGITLFTLTVSAQYYARWLFPGDQATHYTLLWAGYLPVYTLLLGHLIWWKRRSAASSI